MEGRKLNTRRFGFVIIIFAATVFIILMATGVFTKKSKGLNNHKVPDYVDVQLIKIDGHARRGVPLEELNDIVIHYVGNPNTTAIANRNYFDNEGTTVSSHFVIGLDGEIIQCVPLDEKSSASNDRNRDTISIEVCHPDETGKFNPATYDSLVKLTAWLCKAGNLSSDNVIRHYDITGKICPKYFVDNEEAWTSFKSDVAEAIPNTILE